MFSHWRSGKSDLLFSDWPITCRIYVNDTSKFWKETTSILQYCTHNTHINTRAHIYNRPEIYSWHSLDANIYYVNCTHPSAWLLYGLLLFVHKIDTILCQTRILKFIYDSHIALHILLTLLGSITQIIFKYFI